jgi:hypothetical protein
MYVHQENDPWKQTLTSLASASNAVRERSKQASSRREQVPIDRGHKRVDHRPCAQAIRVVEWQTAKRIIVCWCDTTLGHYAEQVWHLAAARRSSKCSLSGCTIKRGDLVFRPRYRGSDIPGNFDHEILASRLQRPSIVREESEDVGDDCVFGMIEPQD